MFQRLVESSRFFLSRSHSARSRTNAANRSNRFLSSFRELLVDGFQNPGVPGYADRAACYGCINSSQHQSVSGEAVFIRRHHEGMSGGATSSLYRLLRHFFASRRP